MNDRRLWTAEEDSLIAELVGEHGCRKWTSIATDMAKIYGEKSRTSKQIRQRWHNHLDPEINKCPWTQFEEQTIFQAHKVHGSKWKEIAKLLHSRTDNSVKNHFYSTLRRSLRRINKFLGFKNSTNQMRVIKPSILSRLVQSAETNTQARMLVDRIFEFASFKPSKSNMTDRKSSIEDKDKHKYQTAIEKLVQFNGLYQKNKKESIRKSVKGSNNNNNNKNKNKNRNKNSSKNGNSNLIVECSFVDVKIEELSCERSYEIDFEMDEQLENQSTLSDKENSSWSDDVISQNNGLLPELERPQAEFDFFGGSILPMPGVNTFMVTGSQLCTVAHLYSHHSIEEKKNICWFEANPDSECINKSTTQLQSLLMHTQTPNIVQEF